MILEPGTFNVNDYRKPIPVVVKLQVLLNYFRDHCDDAPPSWFAEDLRFDHRPPLCDRPYDEEANDFIPPQHDPDHIEVVHKADHDERTFGRKAGAEKTVTTRGSDVGEAARTRKIKRNQAVHEDAMARKLHPNANRSTDKFNRFKRKIPSRPFSKEKKKWSTLLSTRTRSAGTPSTAPTSRRSGSRAPAPIPSRSMRAR